MYILICFLLTFSNLIFSTNLKEIKSKTVRIKYDENYEFYHLFLKMNNELKIFKIIDFQQNLNELSIDQKVGNYKSESEKIEKINKTNFFVKLEKNADSTQYFIRITDSQSIQLFNWFSFKIPLGNVENPFLKTHAQQIVISKMIKELGYSIKEIKKVFPAIDNDNLLKDDYTVSYKSVKPEIIKAPQYRTPANASFKNRVDDCFQFTGDLEFCKNKMKDPKVDIYGQNFRTCLAYVNDPENPNGSGSLFSQINFNYCLKFSENFLFVGNDNFKTCYSLYLNHSVDSRRSTDYCVDHINNGLSFINNSNFDTCFNYSTHFENKFQRYEIVNRYLQYANYIFERANKCFEFSQNFQFEKNKEFNQCFYTYMNTLSEYDVKLDTDLKAVQSCMKYLKELDQ